MAAISAATTAGFLETPARLDESTRIFVAGTRLKLPVWFVGCVIGVCILPLLLNGLGVSFDSSIKFSPVAPDVTAAVAVDQSIRMLSGTYIHTLLEWTATVIAVFAALLAFTHFRISRDVVTPIIGIALLSAGLVDAFHTLAADRLIAATSDNREFIPFTWAISRTFNAVIPLTALALVFFTRRYEPGSKTRQNSNLLVWSSIGIFAVAYAVIHYCASSSSLPQTMFPDAPITRPWDIYPLGIYAISGLVIYPLFNRRMNTYFTQALWLSVIPDVATQLHMAFGSTALFDNHFNIAHSLKIVAYLVPCVGLILDYISTYERADNLQLAIGKRVEELARSNADLEKFAYVASHDLKAPLRAIDSLSSFIEEDLADSMNEETRKNMGRLRGRVHRLEMLMDDLLQYSRAGQTSSPPVLVRTDQMVAEIVDLMDFPDGFSVRTTGMLPDFYTDKAPFEMVLRNLIGNAVKHHDSSSGLVEVSGRETEHGYEFSVADDGPGIPTEHHERIFEMFQTLKARDQQEGSGMGLAIVKKLVELHEGTISIVSEDGQRGTKFVFSWPKHTQG